jgi:hypothetical protein
MLSGQSPDHIAADSVSDSTHRIENLSGLSGQIKRRH